MYYQSASTNCYLLVFPSIHAMIDSTFSCLLISEQWVLFLLLLPCHFARSAWDFPAVRRLPNLGGAALIFPDISLLWAMCNNVSLCLLWCICSSAPNASSQVGIPTSHFSCPCWALSLASSYFLCITPQCYSIAVRCSLCWDFGV